MKLSDQSEIQQLLESIAVIKLSKKVLMIFVLYILYSKLLVKSCCYVVAVLE